jgi:hypothetical protein
MEQRAKTATKQKTKKKPVALKFVDRDGKKGLFRSRGKEGKVVILSEVTPQAGTVSNPFVVCGYFDFPGDLPQVSVTSDSTGDTYGPEAQICPPSGDCAGMDWEFRFNVPSDRYTLDDLEGSTHYQIYPLDVI